MDRMVSPAVQATQASSLRFSGVKNIRNRFIASDRRHRIDMNAFLDCRKQPGPVEISHAIALRERLVS